tara:strand:+ start:1536 stop:2036 length:501 start_codon:yes stop_codon:yes gene_type:complete
MASANYDISHEQGTNFVLNVNYYDESGIPIDLSQGYWAQMDVRGQRYELDENDDTLKLRFSSSNTYGVTGTIIEGGKTAGHISLDGEYIYPDDIEGATTSGVTGQISLSFSKEISRQLDSGTSLYDLFIFDDRGITTGTTGDASAEKLLAGKFIISPSITDPEFGG